jgi:EpsG family
LTYLLIFAALLLGGWLSRGNDSLRNALYYACLVALFLFVGFRYEVGCDWDGYLNIFEQARHKQSSEVAFWAANWLLHYYDLDYPYINVIAAVGFFAGLHALAKRQPDPLSVLILAFPILILELAMSAIRQAIAVGFVCFAYNAFVDARLLRYIFFVMIAASFHSSAMFLLLLAPFVRGEFSRQRIALGGLLALPGAYHFLASETFETYSQRYIGTSTEASGAPFRSGLLALTGTAFLWFLSRKWKAIFTREYKLVNMSSYMMLATFPLTLYSSVSGDRIAYYFYPIQLMILGRLPFLVQGQYWAAAPYAAAALFLLVWTQLSSLFERCYLPYQIWW